MELLVWNFFAPFQLFQAHLYLRVQPLTESLAVFSECKSFQQGIRLVLVQAFYFFDCQFNAAHDGNLSKRTRFRNSPFDHLKGAEKKRATPTA